MIENKIDNIRNHLEFLGYSIESALNDKGAETLTARGQGKPTLFIWFGKPEDNRQHVLFTSTWNGLKKVTRIEQLAHINKINMELVVTKAMIDFSDDTLMFRSVYTADYNKKAFGDFFDLYVAGIRQAINEESFSKLFVE